MDISLCMIARNEASWLPISLTSVRRSFSEMIIVDTGSTDKTKEIAAAEGAQVFNFQWQDDFSAARNFAASKARARWIFFLDADEVLLEKDLQALSRLVLNNIDVYELTHRNYLVTSPLSGAQGIESEASAELLTIDLRTKAFQSYVDGRQARLYRNRAEPLWTRCVHETILPRARELNLRIEFSPSLVIHHFAALKDPEFLQKKNEMYLKLMIQRLQESPNEPAAWFDIAIEWTKHGKLDEAEKSYRQALKLRPVWPEASRNLDLVQRLRAETEHA